MILIAQTQFLNGASDRLADLDTITVQLKGAHQFQFAGFYAAIDQGYYRESNLEVTIVKGFAGQNYIQEVVSGRAEFGVETPVLLLKRLQGQPVVVLASIFQKSPVILITLAESGLTTPQDLIGKRVMSRLESYTEVDAMFEAVGIDRSKIEFIEHSLDISDLVEARVDAWAAYKTDQPFVLQEMGIEYNLIEPLDYGIDFYGDCIFTNQHEIDLHTDRVRSFLKATSKGWIYALNHVDELIGIIKDRYQSSSSEELLSYEAEQISLLVMPELVEIGHINRNRWKRTAETYYNLGLSVSAQIPNNFLILDTVAADKTIPEAVWRIIIIGTLVVIFTFLVMAVFNHRLQLAVARQTKELRESETRFRKLIDHSPDGIYVRRGDKYISVNSRFTEIFGYSEEELLADEFTAMTLVAPEFHDYLLDRRQENSNDGPAKITAVFDGISKAGALINLEVTTTNLDWDDEEVTLGIMRDVTERKKLEAQFQQSQKMEAIGRLAGGVAHDFNNLLTAIACSAELAQLGLDDGESIREDIKIISDTVDRAADLVRQLLAFSRKQVVQQQVIDLNGTLRLLAQMLERVIGEDINLKLALSEELHAIKADPSQLEQIVMNLAVNARDAMPQGGTLVIKTGNAILGPDFISSHDGKRKGEYVQISISDDGVGMDKETREHIFEPFFTTKGIGEGTGLGLSTVYGIIKQNDGFVDVYSEMGHGTTFKIYLPVSEESVGEMSESPDVETIVQADATILMIEDDDAVRKVVIKSLSQIGYTVLEADDAEKARHFTENYNGTIDLILSDVIMPGMNGPELVTELKGTLTTAKVLFMSGHTEEAIVEKGILRDDINFISKPFRPQDLAEKIDSVLSTPREDNKK